MKKTKITVYCMIFIFTFSVCAYAGHPIPDSGQTRCYNDTAEIPCPQPGEDFYGQDANYTINPPSYTKLDVQGNDLSDSATSWTMVRDNVTGLIWEVKTDDYTAHDKDSPFTWYDSNSETNGGSSGTPGYGTDTEDFVNDLNAQNFGGYSDWRLPTINELTSIVDYEKYEPAIDTEYFPSTQSAVYWSATPSSGYTSLAWCIFFNYGGGGAALVNRMLVMCEPCDPDRPDYLII